MNAFGPTSLNEPKTPIPTQLSSMDRLRMRDYQKNLDFYAGQQWPVQRRNIRQRRLTFNYARTIVDKTCSFLLQGTSFAIDPTGPDDVAAATHREQVMRAVHRWNNMELLDYDSEIDCAVLGDGCFKVVWDPAVDNVRITAPDMTGIFVWLEADDHTRFWRLAHRYTLSPQAIRQQEMFYPQILQWSQRAPTITEVWTDESWQTFWDNTLADERPNPYGFIPYVVYPNVRRPKQFFGESDITSIREVCVELNRASTQLSSILEVCGNPITVLEGITDSKDIAIEPGAIWEIPVNTKAYLLSLLEHGGLDVHLNYIGALYRMLHDLGESPRAAFGGYDGGSGSRSGVALSIELDPLVKRVQRKRLVRAAAFRQRTAMVLRLWEQFRGEPMEPYDCRVVWGGLLPIDRAREIEGEIALVNTGLHSRSKAASNLGDLDHETDFQAWLLENERISAAGGIPPEPAGQTERIAVG